MASQEACPVHPVPGSDAFGAGDRYRPHAFVEFEAESMAYDAGAGRARRMMASRLKALAQT